MIWLYFSWMCSDSHEITCTEDKTTDYFGRKEIINTSSKQCWWIAETEDLTD
jgi:hypothetical protein